MYIQSIYSNEWGSPFVRFSAAINSTCSSGNGLYLYNLEMPPVDDELRHRRVNKMATVLAAKAAGARVVLDYFYDPGMSGWEACYIHGIEVID